MPNLFPGDINQYKIDEANVLEELNRTAVGYKESIYFDSHTGDARLNGSGQFVKAGRQEAWIQWCEKVLRTPRFQCKAYSSAIGIDMNEIFCAPNQETAEAILYGEITDALMADPYGRTAYIDSISFEWLRPDSVSAAVVVVGIDGSSSVLQAEISRQQQAANE